MEKNKNIYDKDYILQNINIYIDMELVLPMYNVYPYFSLKNLGKNVHIIPGKIW